MRALAKGQTFPFQPVIYLERPTQTPSLELGQATAQPELEIA